MQGGGGIEALADLDAGLAAVPALQRGLGVALRHQQLVPAAVDALAPRLRDEPQVAPEERHRAGRPRDLRRGDELLVPKRDAEAALERWYRRQARTEIGERLDAVTARHGTPYDGLTIRSQKTRWASCSSRGHMSFNWRLLLAPPEVLDYVVEHEVCHLEILDHSSRFWALLEARVPDWRDHARWLRRYGATLRL